MAFICLPLTRAAPHGAHKPKAPSDEGAVEWNETEGEKEFRYIEALAFLSLSQPFGWQLPRQREPMGRAYKKEKRQDYYPAAFIYRYA